MAAVVETPDYGIYHDRGSCGVTIRVTNGYPSPDSLSGFEAAVRALYREADAAEESALVLDFDVSRLDGISPSCAYRVASLFKDLREASDRILDRSLVRMQGGVVSRTVRAFLELYPLARPVDFVEMAGGAVTAWHRIPGSSGRGS